MPSDAMKKLHERVDRANRRFAKACEVIVREETKTIEYLEGYWSHEDTKESMNHACDAIREQAEYGVDTELRYLESEINRAKQDFYKDIKQFVNLDGYQTLDID